MTVHRDSASSASDESESDTANGDWKEITDGDDTKTHNLKYSELQGPKHAPPQGAPHCHISICFSQCSFSRN